MHILNYDPLTIEYYDGEGNIVVETFKRDGTVSTSTIKPLRTQT